MPHDAPWAIERNGESERVKELVHEAMLALAGAAGLYNWAAWRARREPRLFINALLYGALAIFEATQAARHR